MNSTQIDFATNKFWAYMRIFDSLMKRDEVSLKMKVVSTFPSLNYKFKYL